MARRSGAGALALVVGVLLLLGVGAAAPASAHAYLDTSNPADGSRVQSAPSTLRLGFSEHVVLGATRITLVDDHGHRLRVGHLSLSTRDAEDTEVPSTVVADLPSLSPGAYRVSWETLSSDDLHRTAGVLVFGVGRDVRAAGGQEQLPRSEEAAARGWLLGALALLLGGLLAGRVLRSGRVAGTATTLEAEVRVVRRLARAGALVALLAGVALLGEQLLAGGGGAVQVLGSSYGVRWGVRAVGLLAALAAVTPDPSTSRWRRTVLAVGLGGTLLGTAALGHSGAGGLHPVRLLVAAAHLAATLSWAGAVCCLALVLLRRRVRGQHVELWRCLQRFGRPAATCLGVAVVTGVWLASDVVGSVDAALSTFYGRVLLVKVALVGGAAGLGLVSHLRLRHDPGARLRRLPVPTEALVLAGVVLLTAVLTSGQPATERTWVGRDVPSAGSANGPVADLQVTADVRPDHVGTGIAVVSVFDTRRPAPAEVLGVDLAAGRGAPVALHPLADHQWSAPLRLETPGRTTLTVTVHRAGLADTVGRFAWTVGDAPGTVAPTLVSRAPLTWTLRLVSLGLAAALLLLLAVTALLRRRRRRTAPATSPSASPRESADASVVPGPSTADRELVAAGVPEENP